MFDSLTNLINNQPANAIVTDIKLQQVDSLTVVSNFIINVMLGIAFSVSMLAAGYSGVLYIMSDGDPKATAKAWSSFFWGTIGMLGVLGIFGIKRAVLTVANVSTPELLEDVPTF